MVAAAVLVGVAWDSENKGVPPVPGQCTVAGLAMTLTAEQVANAATIAQVGRDRGLPERAVVIALATAQQESRLRNLDYGDRDSLGLFQQRPSSGWGSPEQVQDPVYAAEQVLRPPGRGARLGDRPAHRGRAEGPAVRFPGGVPAVGGAGAKLAAAQISELPDQIVCVPDEAPAG